MYFRPKEKLPLLKVKHADTELKFPKERKAVIEREIASQLTPEILDWVCNTEEKPSSLNLGGPRTRLRSNSDSNLYCKVRDEVIAESKREAEVSLGNKTKYLDSEKEAFVQSYVQNIREAHSMVTETSDSGITTHGAPSDLDEMEDFSGKYNLLFG